MLFTVTSTKNTSIAVNQKKIHSFLSHYDIGEFISYERMKKGFANLLFRARTTKGEFVFKIVVRNNPRRVQYEIQLLNFLKNLPIPQPMQAKNGKYLLNYGKYKAFIYPYLEGKPRERFTSSMLRQVGSFLAKMHNQTKGFSSSVKRFEFYNITKQESQTMVRIGKRQLSDRRIRDALTYIQDNLLQYQIPKSVPQGAMHIDLKPENTLFVGERLTGVVDFDNSYDGPLVLDLANTLMWFCSKKGRFDFDKAREIYAGYKKERTLTTREKQNVFKSLHYAFLSHVVVDIYHFTRKTICPKKYILWGIDNLIKTQQKLNVSKQKFNTLLNLNI